MGEMRARIILDLAGNLQAQARRNAEALAGMSSSGQRAFSRLGGAATLAGKGLDAMGSKYAAALAGAGATYKSVQAIMQSAALDKELVRVAQTAGEARERAGELRGELLRMAQDTGQPVEDLLGGFNNLVQSGEGWDASLATIKAINGAMAVTGANADVLSSGLTVAGKTFNFDLSKPGQAAMLLDQMTSAGRLANVELEFLSGVFARIGVNAKNAGFNFEETLGFAEQLSLIERNPERLATLADSTLRLFTNMNYAKKAAKATGVKFYDANGERRAAFDVLEDISAKYRKLTTDAQRDKFIDRAFGDADLDTKKGLAMLLNGDAIASARDMSRHIAAASGTIGKDLSEALDNSVDQANRLKATLRQAADDFAQPINAAISRGVKYLLDEQKFTGKQLLAGGVGLAALGYGAVKGGSALARRMGGMGSGLVAGKALEEVAGVTPVYVVNMPGGGIASAMPGGTAGAAGVGGALAKSGGRWSKLFSRGGLGLLAAAGTALELGSVWSSDESTGAKVRDTGGTLGGLGGSLAGAKLGAAAGTAVMPGVGTAIGGLAGSIIGFLAGQFGGEKLAGLFAPKDVGQAVADALNEREAKVVLEVKGAASVASVQSRGLNVETDVGLNMGH